MTISRHLMLDVETFSLKPNAFVWEIGLLPFTMNSTDDMNLEVGKTDHIIVDPFRHTTADVNIDTVKWTQTQRANDPVALAICDYMLSKKSLEDSGRLQSVLERSSHYVLDVLGTRRTFEAIIDKAVPAADRENTFIWAKNAAFDFPIMASLFGERFVPWHRRQQCCLYTARNLALSMGWRPTPREENTHAAVDDCLNQVAELSEIITFLRWARR